MLEWKGKISLVGVNITHPLSSDLELVLESPSGTQTTLWLAGSGAGSDLVGVFPATLRPAEDLNAFDGEDFDGTWALEVTDVALGDVGTLNSWSMSVVDSVGAFDSGSPIVVPGLTNGKTYSCTVNAITALGEGPLSNSVSVMPMASTPQAPTITSIEPEDSGLLVRFTTPNDGGSPITDYTVTCGDQSASGPDSPITVTGLNNDQEYSCSVVATNAVGSSPPSMSAPGTPEAIIIHRLNIILIKAALNAQEGG